MRVGIIAEGKSDQAVIENILCGALSIDRESIQLIRPSDGSDETDLYGQRGNNALVKQDCLERRKIRDFFTSPIDEGERLLVIHLDTDEIGRGDAILKVARPAQESLPSPTPKKSKKKTESTAVASFVDTFRDNIIAEIDGWLEGEFKPQLRYAIAIEETEAWLLALHDDRDTSELREPKKVWIKFQNRPNALTKQERRRYFVDLNPYDAALDVSRGFQRKKTLLDAAKKNRSLELFVVSLNPKTS